MPPANADTPRSNRRSTADLRRQRGEMSCAECRRLKLKCNKEVPCGSCKRRGCAAICPNGSLVTGEGTRFVLADTQKLHQKIARMSDRIRQLEDALSIVQSMVTHEPHPLLDPELLRIKSSMELHAAINTEVSQSHQDGGEDTHFLDAFGTLALGENGAATFYGRSAGSESLLIGEVTTVVSPSNTANTSLPPVISALSSTFPWATGSQACADVDQLMPLLQSFLPSWDDAFRLSNLYLDQAPWFFGAVTSRQLIEELLPIWYEDAAQYASSPTANSPCSVLSSGSATPKPKGTAHELALLFVIFCFGAMTDLNLPAAPNNVLADHYYCLTKAALTVEPVLERPPSVATVQTVALMAIYEGLKSGENSIESTWALMGVATKLAQSIGLHRDCARWNLPPAEVQKRRSLFWELFITDCWQSLATGRLATFSLPFVDCELPSDTDQTLADDGTPQPSFPYWKARFGADCVAAVVQGTLTSRAPKYSIILELDRKVRDIELPKYAQGPPPEGKGLSETMSHFMPTNYRELTLLYIHRCFFAHAITSNPNDPIKSPYAPSFLAGYRSACDLLGSIKQQFHMFPAQIARFWVLWTHAFSASVMISSVVTNGSKSKVAPAALLELRAACDLFEKAASYGGRAGKFLPILKRLQEKAYKIYYDTSTGVPPTIHNDIFRPSANEDDRDELSIFSGKTHTLTTRITASISTATQPSRSPSDSPTQVYTDNPAFANVHPKLVNELNEFDGHINAQLQRAYHADSDGFARALLHHHPPTPSSTASAGSRPSLQQSYSQRIHHTQKPQIIPQQSAVANRPQHRSQQRSISMDVAGTVPAAPTHLNHTMSNHRSYTNLHLEQYNSPVSEQSMPGFAVYASSPGNMHPQALPMPELISPASSTHSEQIIPSPESDTISMQSIPTQYWSTTHQQDNPGVNYPSHDYHRQISNHHQLPSPQQRQLQYYPQYYTPEGSMKGFAAEDQSLQQTWQSYMYKVGSPRLMFEE